MLAHVSRQTTITLVNLLVPTLLYRARAFSTPATKSVRQRTLNDDPLVHSKLLEHIMAQPPPRRLPDTTRALLNEAVTRIQRASADRDLPSALQHWQYLAQQRNSLPDSDAYHISPALERDITNLLTSQIYQGNAFNEWNDEMKAAVENFSMQTAKTHSANALAAYMLVLIKANKAEAVINLYGAFLQSLEHVATKQDKPASSEEGLALSDIEDANPDQIDPGRVSILLAVTTAHAMQDSFAAALETYLATDIRFHHYRRQKFLGHLEENPDLHSKATKFFDRIQVASLVARPPSLSRHIINLSHSSTAHLLQKFYEDILDGIRGSDPYLAAEPSAVSETKLVALTEAGWTSFQTGFIKCERPDLAAKVWRDLAQFKIRPGVTMWTALLDTYADLRNSRQALETWDMMQKYWVKPDVLSYRAIIAVLFDDRKPEIAMERFKEYQNSFKDDPDRAITVYNTVLRGLLRQNNNGQASALITTMQTTGPSLDIVSYNTLLAYYSRLNDFKGLANIVAKMAAANISGDVVTFSTILTALLQVGKQDAPLTILNLMRKQGIQPNVATYSAIIDHQMRGQTEANLKAALLMLDKMEQDQSIKPNEVTYTSILSGLYRGNWLSHKKADEVRKNIVGRMKRLKLAFRLPTYHILIRACLDSPDPAGYQDALALLQEMEIQRIPRVQTTWYLLFSGLMQRGQWEVAKEMVAKMHLSGHEPTLRVQKLINDIRKHR
ncbi:hypothetical protein B0H34DRAFT_683047 [Crassisporium funariophilum]|nr:hypothetical protein B0H34DRAFT_683047 [Crassisporium funariophilum]